MTDRSLKVGAFLIVIGFSALISFAFFCMSTTHSQRLCNQLEYNVCALTSKVDSLEHVINTSFKQKRDTIFIQVVPQTVKVYYTESNTKTLK